MRCALLADLQAGRLCIYTGEGCLVINSGFTD